MIFIKLPIKSDIPVVAPGDFCCNCGSADNVKPELTDLRRMPLFGLAGAEIKISLPFPYCAKCVETSRRRRPTLLGIIAISLLLALILGMCWFFVGPQFSEDTTQYIVAPLIILLSLGAVVSLFSLRKPSGTQTSSYQPVVLKNTGHKWPADITGLELAFTNRAYAKEFAAANLAAITAGKIKVAAI